MQNRAKTLKRTLLILGGTKDSIDLIKAVEERFGNNLRVILSLAGSTKNPVFVAHETRIGGFGGIQGLANYIRESGTNYLIDASHPFANQISKHGCLAAAMTATPHLMILRPLWPKQTKDNWFSVKNMAAAADNVVALGNRAFLSVGVRELKHFTKLKNTWFLVRLIDPPLNKLPLTNFHLVLGRGPFDIEREIELLKQHRINVLVTRASGGTSTSGKIDAARLLNLPVIMVERPDPPPGEIVHNTESAIKWLLSQIDNN